MREFQGTRRIIRVQQRDYEAAKELWPEVDIQVVKLCSICQLEPGRYHGGPCNECERELGVGA